MCPHEYTSLKPCLKRLHSFIWKNCSLIEFHLITTQTFDHSPENEKRFKVVFTISWHCGMYTCFTFSLPDKLLVFVKSCVRPCLLTGRYYPVSVRNCNHCYQLSIMSYVDILCWLDGFCQWHFMPKPWSDKLLLVYISLSVYSFYFTRIPCSLFIWSNWE